MRKSDGFEGIRGVVSGIGASRTLRLALIVFAALGWAGCQSEEQKEAKHFEAGVRYNDMGRFDQAIQELEAVVAINPNNPKAQILLGSIYKDRSRNAKKAIEHYRKAVEVDHQNAEAWIAIKDLYLIRQDPPSAILALQDGLHFGAFDKDPEQKKAMEAELQKLKAENPNAASAPSKKKPAAKPSAESPAQE